LRRRISLSCTDTRSMCTSRPRTESRPSKGLASRCAAWSVRRGCRVGSRGPAWPVRSMEASRARYWVSLGVDGCGVVAMGVLPVRGCWGGASQGCVHPCGVVGQGAWPHLPHGRSPVRKVVSTLFLAGAVRFVVGPSHLDLRCPRPFGWVRVVRGGGPCLVAILGADPPRWGGVGLCPVHGCWSPWHQGTYFVAWFVRPCRPSGVRGPACWTVRAVDTRLTGQGAVSPVESAWSGATVRAG